MSWKDRVLYETDTSFRLTFLQWKMQEVPVQVASRANRFCFRPVPYYDCNMAGLKNSYPKEGKQALGFEQDGILFYHKETHYELGTSPLVLVWKDKGCARYFIDTKLLDGKTQGAQTCILQVSQNGAITALEGEKVGQVPAQALSKLPGLAQGPALLRFQIKGVLPPSDPEGLIKLVDLRFTGPASPARVLPDSLSKIEFQARARIGKGVSSRQIAMIVTKGSSPAGKA